MNIKKSSNQMERKVQRREVRVYSDERVGRWRIDKVQQPARRSSRMFIAIVLLFSVALFSTQTVFAQDWKSDWSKFPGGAKAVCGNDNDVDNDDDGLIELCYLEDLNAVRNVLDGTSYQAPGSATTTTQGCASSGCIGYELVRDLDFQDDDSYRTTANKMSWTTSTGWTPIGPDAFSGIFEGNGKTLSNLFINRPSGSDMALFFNVVRGGTINGIGLLDVDVSGQDRVGGLVSQLSVGGIITHSYNTGLVQGRHWVGGLTGISNGRITNSYSAGQIIGTGVIIGGFIGTATAGSITNSYSTGPVNGTDSRTGGLLGGLGEFGGVTNSYSTGKVSSSVDAGGLIGLLGLGTMSTDSYWNIETSGQSSSAGGTSATTAQLQAPTGPSGIYSAWSEDDWDFGSAISYPAVKYNEKLIVNGYRTCSTPEHVSQQPACGTLLAGQRTRLVPVLTATQVTAQAVEGETVTLDAEQGDVAYQWSQTAGSTVSYLSTTDSAMFRFLALPNVAMGSATTGMLRFRLTIGAKTQTVQITVYKVDNGPIAEPMTIRINAGRIAVSEDLTSDPDGAGTNPKYQWQICSTTCSREVQWQSVSGDATSNTYKILEAEAVENNQFRVQITYTDGQNYPTTRTSTPLGYTNQKPTVKNTDNQVVVTIGAPFNQQILTGVFEDINEDPLRYTASGLPPDSNLILSTDGTLRTRGTSRVAGNATTNTASAVIVTVTASDGISTATTTFRLFFSAVVITDIGPIATTEGEVVTIIAEASGANSDDLNYLWRATAGDKTASILADSLLTSTTLVFTIPKNWANTTQVTLSLALSVGEGATTSTKPVIVNITRVDNGGLATMPTITEAEQKLTVSAALVSDPDGAGTIEAYQWQLCLADANCSPGGQWKDISGATNDFYQIPKAEAVGGNQFRVQINYRDGQGYSGIALSEVFNYQAKAVFMRLKLFLEGALQ